MDYIEARMAMMGLNPATTSLRSFLVSLEVAERGDN